METAIQSTTDIVAQAVTKAESEAMMFPPFTARTSLPVARPSTRIFPTGVGSLGRNGQANRVRTRSALQTSSAPAASTIIKIVDLN